MKSFLVLLFGLGLTAARAADLQVLAHVVELPSPKLAELLATGKTGDALFGLVRAEVLAGRATALDTSLARIAPGQKCLLESTAAVITPDEYEPSSGLTPPPASPPPPPPPPPPLRLPWTWYTFSTRNIGLSWEVEFNGSANGHIDLYATWNQVTEAAAYPVTDWQDELGQRHTETQPHYTSLRIPVSLTLKSGSWTLLATQSGHTADGAIDFTRKILFFLRADDLGNPAN